VAELVASLDELRAKRTAVERRLIALTQRRESFGRTDREPPAAPADDAVPAAATGVDSLELAEISREIGDNKRLLATLEKQLEARTRALPVYRETLETDALAEDLRARRDHPMHTLLRRMYHEQLPVRAQ
jgi:hypothetical protein